ncbi:hypothetical protein BpHYR1_049146 [Brachionus plicatilis]|uniref:Uncharacterized protein n=1 Tax=Brachionus plicatilis TaxID=10195 RepID=A0A3M7SKJ3_BRAPC|nr:hypothetical protein BpHYR1_049146 [Brachionus plicatilis]
MNNLYKFNEKKGKKNRQFAFTNLNGSICMESFYKVIVTLFLHKNMLIGSALAKNQSSNNNFKPFFKTRKFQFQ